MWNSLSNWFHENKSDTLVAKSIFFIVALLTLYNGITAQEWWHSVIFYFLVLICGLLISRGYEDLKFSIMRIVGLEVANSRKSRTAREVQDLLSDSDASDLSEVDVNEEEGRYQLRFERE